MAVAIIGSGAGATFVVKFSGTVAVIGISAGATVVVVVVGTGAWSTRIEGSAGVLVELLEGMIVVVVSVNIGAVALILTGTETENGLLTTDLSQYCVIMHLTVLLRYTPLPSIHTFYPDDRYITFCHLITSASTK